MKGVGTLHVRGGIAASLQYFSTLHPAFTAIVGGLLKALWDQISLLLEAIVKDVRNENCQVGKTTCFVETLSNVGVLALKNIIKLCNLIIDLLENQMCAIEQPVCSVKDLLN